MGLVSTRTVSVVRKSSVRRSSFCSYLARFAVSMCVRLVSAHSSSSKLATFEPSSNAHTLFNQSSGWWRGGANKFHGLGILGVEDFAGGDLVIECLCSPGRVWGRGEGRRGEWRSDALAFQYM